MFFLSEETPIAVEFETWVAAGPPSATPAGIFWQENAHTTPPRLGLVIQAGWRALIGPVTTESQDALLLVFGAALPAISSDGLDVRVAFRNSTRVHDERTIMEEHLRAFDAAIPWRELRVELGDLQQTTGYFVVECGPGPAGDPCADWLSIYECVVARPTALPLARARAFKAYRTRNEITHFTDTSGILPIAPKTSIWERLTRSAATDLRFSPPLRYAGERLERELKKELPPFARRLAQLTAARKRPFRMLSICCGSGLREQLLLRHAARTDLQVTLLDVNETSLTSARQRLCGNYEIHTIACDVNELDLQGEKYDVILCSAGLHHLIELEHVTHTVAQGLTADGEFWSIGEYIGRPGSRLWPETYDIANEYFQTLPERYRVNQYDANRRPDKALPNTDHSISTFEGIRAPDILPCLEREFTSIDMTTHACFVLRLYDAAYAANYDVSRAEDRHWIRKAVRIDANHQRAGGRPTIMNAIFRRK